MLALKVAAAGVSSGLVLSEEAMTRLGVKEGDTLYLTAAPGGGYRLTPYDPDFAQQMKLPKRSCAMTARRCERWPSERRLAEHGGLGGIRDPGAV